MSILLEAAVESVEDALAAVEGGADRLELCANLKDGGTTPPAALIADVLRRVDIPVFVMIRPRAGSFVYTARDFDKMRREIDMAHELEADGVVFGILDSENRVDVARTQVLVELADGMPATFHKAFDRTIGQNYALDALMEAGVDRVLTSAGAKTAAEGAFALRELAEQAGDQIILIAGGGVRPDNVAKLVETSGVHEVHARCELSADRMRGIQFALADLLEVD
jgi:copper homeostasis protein